LFGHVIGNVIRVLRKYQPFDERVKKIL